MLARLIGWPPAMFTVAATEMYGMRSAPTSSHERVELGKIDVALEGMLRPRVVRLVDDDVVEGGAGELLVRPASS